MKIPNSKMRTTKHIAILLISYICIAFIAFEIRGFLLFDPLIPFEWPLKLTEFAIIHSTKNLPFTPPSNCDDYKNIVRIMGEEFPKHSYGQSEFYSYNPDDPYLLQSREPIIDRGVSYDEAGVLKWRQRENEPYIAFELAGNWTNRYDNADGKGVSVQQISESIPNFRREMENVGFVFSSSNDIPLYRYPQGQYARKIGFTKGNYLYQFTIIEDDVPFNPDHPDEILPDEYQKPVHISMNCAENSPELRTMYDKYLTIPHKVTGETTVVYAGRKDNAVHFKLYYPGGVLDQVEDEYYDLRENPMKLVVKNDNFANCDTFESLKIGKEFPCFRPSKREFDIITY